MQGLQVAFMVIIAAAAFCMVADDPDVVVGAAAVGLVCDHHLRSDHGDRRALRAGGMMQGDTERIMREGLRQALMEAMSNL